MIKSFLKAVKRLPWPLAFWMMAFPILSAADTLRIGTISADPAKDVKEFQPLAAYLGSQLGGQGIDSVVVVVAQGIREMAELLKANKVDLYIDSPFPVLLTQHLADNRILLRRWKRGVSVYSSVMFTRAGAGVSSLEQLSGRMVAFEEPFSTASYYLAKMHLVQAGLKLRRKTDAQDGVAPDETGYVFSADDRNTLAWVLKGRVAAGAMNDEKYRKLSKGREKDLVVLATTTPVPRHLVTYRKNLDPALLRAVRAVLLEMERSPRGLDALRAFNETTRFDELDDADKMALDELRTRFKAQIKDELAGTAP